MTDLNINGVPVGRLLKAYDNYQRNLEYAREYARKRYEERKDEIRSKNRERYRMKAGITDETQKSRRGRPVGSYKA
jgi:hypothetical protein